jgi:hypothetical protein
VRIVRPIALFVAVAFCGVFSIFAAEVLVSPDEASLEKWAIGALYQTSETEPELEVDGNSSISVPTSGGSATIFSGANTDVSLEQSSELVGFALVFRPKQLRYTVSVAQVRRFELEFASGSVTNSLRADNGYRIGVGLAGSFVPVTAASVGIGWSIDYRHLVADLDRFDAGGTVSAIDNEFEQDEFQAAATAAYRWKWFSPYAGLKVQRWISRLTDHQAKASIRGVKDGISPFLGIEVTPLPGESAVVEASFAEEESITASWIVKF